MARSSRRKPVAARALPAGRPLPDKPGRRARYEKPPPLAAILAAGGEGYLLFERAIVGASLAPLTVEKYEAAWLCYEKFLGGLREPLAARPVTATKLNMYVAFKCHEWDNAVSASQWRSQIVCHYRHFTGEELEFSRAERQLMKSFDKGCHNVYGCRSEQTPGITSDDLRAIHAALRPSPAKDIDEWLTWVYSVVAYSCLLRPNEFTKGSRVRVRDALMFEACGSTPAGVEITLAATKGKLLTGSSDTERAYARRAPGDPLDACGLLDEYAALFDLHNEANLDRPLFARFQPATARSPAQLTDQELSLECFNARFKTLQVAAGRTVAQIALNLLEGAAVLTRAAQLRSFGVVVPAAAFAYRPRPLRLA